LAQVADACDGFGFAFGPGKGREEHACQNADDGEDHQEFDECKGPGTAGATVE
jgi:hypothetical protein